ncbi:hypothetical protein HMPREF3188_00653 [Tissierellia bacterium KA00581]|nr:hypothetical protein HMPREF3188_00653 [Tissierellia bacterium KA00581]
MVVFMFKILKFNVKAFRLFFFMFIYAFQPSFLAFVIEYLIGIASGKYDFNILIVVGIGSLGLLLFSGIGILVKRFTHKLIEETNIAMKEKVINHLIKSPIKSNKNINYSSFINVDMKLIQKNGLESELSMIQYSFIFIISLFSALYLDILTTVFFFLGMFFSAIISMAGQKKITNYTKKWTENTNKFTTKIEEFSKNTLLLRHFNIQRHVFNQLYNNLSCVEHSLFNLNYHIDIKNEFIMFIGLTMSILLPFSAGVYRINSGYLTIASFMAIVQLSNSLVNPVLYIIQKLNERSAIKPVLETYNSLLKFEFQKEIKIENFKDAICIDVEINKTNIALSICPSQKILIKGSSGIGKSTLIRNLLLNESAKNYTVDNIYINRDYLITSLYSYVPQNKIIFNDTILFNITLGKNYNNVKLNEVIKLTFLEDFINQYGLDYVLDLDGNNISGGEAQRIMIARALLQDTPILLFDEITSALDEDLANKIQKNILSLSDKTIIQVTHNIDMDIEKMYDKTIVLY